MNGKKRDSSTSVMHATDYTCMCFRARLSVSMSVSASQYVYVSVCVCVCVFDVRLCEWAVCLCEINVSRKSFLYDTDKCTAQYQSDISHFWLFLFSLFFFFFFIFFFFYNFGKCLLNEWPTGPIGARTKHEPKYIIDVPIFSFVFLFFFFSIHSYSLFI